VFRAIVANTAWSGLISFVLTATDYKAIDKLLVLLARRVLAGKAVDQEGAHPVKHTNLAVQRLAGIASTLIELRISRLRFWQRVARDPEWHYCLLSGMFDPLEPDFRTLEAEYNCGIHPGTDVKRDSEGNEIHLKHPWSELLLEDIESLSEYDDLACIPDMLGGDVRRLFWDDGCKEEFVAADWEVLRSSYLAVCIPPVGWVHADAPETVDLQVVDRFACPAVMDDGSVCGRRFNSFRALNMHFQRALGGDHRTALRPRTLGTSNECCLCRCRFVDREGCKRHLTRSYLRGECRGRGSLFPQQLILPESLDCPLCDRSFLEFEHYQYHVASHHQSSPIFLESDE